MTALLQYIDLFKTLDYTRLVKVGAWIVLITIIISNKQQNLNYRTDLVAMHTCVCHKYYIINHSNNNSLVYRCL